MWISGRWEWKRGKWEWLAGHWERQRAGKEWREGRWDRKDDHWVFVDGEWVDAGSPPIVPPDRPGRPDRPRRWKLENPVVSSYWPAKGTVGTRVVIRGRNFAKDTEVVFGGGPTPALKVGPTKIEFKIPPDPKPRQAIGLRANGRMLVVGAFEAVAAYDPVAEARRLEAERRRAAEAAWAARQKELAADRAAREAEWQRRQQEWERTRDDRRIARAKAIRAKWARAFLADQATQDELTLHAQRVAEIVRMKEVAELSNNGKLAVRISIAEARENERHDQRMEALKSTFEVK